MERYYYSLSDTAKAPLVILFSTADWNAPYWTNKQHTAVLFEKYGGSVLYVESFGLRTPKLNKSDLKRVCKRIARAILPARRRTPHIWVLSVLVLPWWHIPAVKRINMFLLSIRIRLFCLFARARTPVIWTYNPVVTDLLDSISHSILVYHSVDDLSAVPGVNAELIQHYEAEILKRADFVFTTSLALQEQYTQLGKRTIHYFSNVADISHFSRARVQAGGSKIPEPVDIQHIPHPRIVYHGELSDYKLDMQLLRHVIQSNKTWQWLFIGMEAAGVENAILAEVREYDHVHFLGHRAYKVLPEYLAHMDVAMLPTQINSYTRAMFPMKFFEYLAAGLPLVATNLPALAELKHLFSVAHNPQEFEQQIASVLSKGDSAVVSLEAIQDYTWEGRFEKMIDIINRGSDFKPGKKNIFQSLKIES